MPPAQAEVPWLTPGVILVVLRSVANKNLISLCCSIPRRVGYSVSATVSGFFYNLGRHLGHKAVPAMRKSKWIWDGLAGTEEEALRAEAALGADMAAELRGTLAPSLDEQTALQLAEVCRRLGACVRDKRRAFHCDLFLDRFPNAMALPGGFIFVSDSLAALCERSPDELAFVIGHEMAHVIRGHAWDRMLNETVLKAASVAAARVGQLGAWLHHQGLALLRSAHSREQEGEADELGLRLAAAAGFAPEGAINMLRRIQQFGSNAPGLGQYLCSHPAASERIAGLQPVFRGLKNHQ